MDLARDAAPLLLRRQLLALLLQADVLGEGSRCLLPLLVEPAGEARKVLNNDDHEQRRYQDPG